MKLEKRTYLRIEEGKQTQDLITQIAFLKAAKALNNLDLKIISLFYTNFYNLVTDKSIGKYISDLVKELGLSENKNNLIAVEKSLNKIGSIRLESPAYEGRKLALYDQDENRKITDSYTLTVPKLTIKADKTTLKGGVIVGDLYVEAKDVTLDNMKIEGNVYFANEEAKSSFTLTESEVTGNQEVQ